MRHDALIIGGSFAGLAAALPLARARRQVLVIDAGQPRNRFASHAHTVLGHDGKPGSQMLAEAREQLRAYPTVQFVNGHATSAVRQASADEDFVVEVDGGQRWFTGRRLLLATGVSDTLPDLPGLAERWGRTVLHCPYCHGYEIGGGAIGVMGAGAASLHQALLLPDWGDVTFFTQGVPELLQMSAQDRAALARRGVTVEDTPSCGWWAMRQRCRAQCWPMAARLRSRPC